MIHPPLGARSDLDAGAMNPQHYAQALSGVGYTPLDLQSMYQQAAYNQDPYLAAGLRGGYAQYLANCRQAERADQLQKSPPEYYGTYRRHVIQIHPFEQSVSKCKDVITIPPSLADKPVDVVAAQCDTVING